MLFRSARDPDSAIWSIINTIVEYPQPDILGFRRDVSNPDWKYRDAELRVNCGAVYLPMRLSGLRIGKSGQGSDGRRQPPQFECDGAEDRDDKVLDFSPCIQFIPSEAKKIAELSRLLEERYICWMGGLLDEVRIMDIEVPIQYRNLDQSSPSSPVAPPHDHLLISLNLQSPDSASLGGSNKPTSDSYSTHRCTRLARRPLPLSKPFSLAHFRNLATAELNLHG